MANYNNIDLTDPAIGLWDIVCSFDLAECDGAVRLLELAVVLARMDAALSEMRNLVAEGGTVMILVTVKPNVSLIAVLDELSSYLQAYTNIGDICDSWKVERRPDQPCSIGLYIRTIGRKQRTIVKEQQKR